MSLAAEKAAAARWIGSDRVRRELGISDTEAAELWGRLEDELEDCRSDGSRELAVIDWRARLIGSRMLNAPLGGQEAA